MARGPSVMKNNVVPLTPEQRIQKYLDDGTVVIDLETGCWNWLGYCPRRYGVLSYQGQNINAHVFFYLTLKGEIPDGLEPDHLCRNKLCVNPDHLEPVTHAENMRRYWKTQIAGYEYVGHR